MAEDEKYPLELDRYAGVRVYDPDFASDKKLTDLIKFIARYNLKDELRDNAHIRQRFRSYFFTKFFELNIVDDGELGEDISMTYEETYGILDEEEALLEEHASLGIYKRFGINCESFLKLPPDKIQMYIRVAKKIIMGESSNLQKMNDELEETL